jgi:hypothetical protein
MNTATYVAFVLIVSVAMLLKNGPTQTTLLVLAGLALLVAVPWYLGTRNRAAEASSVERAAATIWAWLRRVVGISAGALMIAAAAAIALSESPAGSSSHPWLIAAVLLLTGAFCIYVGILGQVPSVSNGEMTSNFTSRISGAIAGGSEHMTHNPSIERTVSGKLRMPPTAAHVER